MIAALYVETNGVYFNLPDVDPWDERRDARLYAGPHPVVAHPPCSRWCRLAGLVEARWGHKRGDDGGCFAAALAAVRAWGGVLEHPAYSGAWAAHDLNAPPSGGGWVNADLLGGWTCYVEQSRYGHRAKKATWLYAFGVELPSLQWGLLADNSSVALVSWCGNHVASGERRERVGKRAASRSPEAFRNALLSIARSVEPMGSAQDASGFSARIRRARCASIAKPRSFAPGCEISSAQPRSRSSKRARSKAWSEDEPWGVE